MDEEANKIKENLKIELANALPEEVSQVVTESINWDAYYFSFRQDKKIVYSLVDDPEGGGLELSLVGGNSSEFIKINASEYPRGVPVPVEKMMSSYQGFQQSMEGGSSGTRPGRLVKTVLKDYTLTP